MLPATNTGRNGNAAITKTTAEPTPAINAAAFEQFDTLGKEVAFSPKRDHLVVYPHIRVWNPALRGQPYRVTGFVDVEGFFANGVLRLSGYSLTSDKPGTEREQLAILGERAASILTGTLKEKRPAITVRVAMPADNTK